MGSVPIRDVYVAFRIPYVYNYINKKGTKDASNHHTKSWEWGWLYRAKPKIETVRGLNIIKVLMMTHDNYLNKNTSSSFRDLKILTEIKTSCVSFYLHANNA